MLDIIVWIFIFLLILVLARNFLKKKETSSTPKYILAEGETVVPLNS